MSSITDLADLIAAYRAQLERTFDGEIARLRTAHGHRRAVDQALRIVEQAQRAGWQRDSAQAATVASVK